ncbi:hypothetical protein [Aminobacter anthyllidis]|uniref:hypothetical protein n=1 Tax=Aminobacter anthyllidis TaxID=1035067 RepID=UPI001FE8FE06|nr:hypothetical protein [Aminobacter anthyllidis]
MKTILLASKFFFAVAGSVLAADAVVYEPVPEAAPADLVWTGGYVGLQAGYAWGGAPYSNGDDESTDYDPNGAFGGIYAGYIPRTAPAIVASYFVERGWMALSPPQRRGRGKSEGVYGEGVEYWP